MSTYWCDSPYTSDSQPQATLYLGGCLQGFRMCLVITSGITRHILKPCKHPPRFQNVSGYHVWDWGATGFYLVQARDAAKCPTTQRQPHNTDTQPQVLVVPPSRNAAQDGHPQWKVLSEGRSHGTRTTFSSCIWDSGMQSLPSPIRSLVPACSACDGKILFSISQKHLERVQENLF